MISIDEAKTVQDDAILVFTESFYSLVFTGTKRICQAFKEAQNSVETQISREEAKKFMINFNGPQ